MYNMDGRVVHSHIQQSPIIPPNSVPEEPRAPRVPLCGENEQTLPQRPGTSFEPTTVGAPALPLELIHYICLTNCAIC